ncbi:chromate transporter [Candidatus Formimonas warabiya]|uniref:Chromate transporter n=1 Tax=Formimonas warabiya TaxID=1761012 RepID=A0A3G1L1X0_FORW1|nr:chromate transporter [Candidatus Formimonas warabiya]ATW28638.1 chromate transporter [Candidatus Formimonas warabiya]
MPILIQLYLTFFKIGLFSFGGGYAMIPLMEKEVVRIHGWLTLSQMVDIIAISQMTPGPIAINLATFVGYQAGGFWGSVGATIGVITPSFLIVLLIAKFYSRFREWETMQRVFKGIRPMVVALIGSAGLSIAQSSMVDAKAVIIGVCSFLVLQYAQVSPLFVILGAGLLGVILYR